MLTRTPNATPTPHKQRNATERHCNATPPLDSRLRLQPTVGSAKIVNSIHVTRSISKASKSIVLLTLACKGRVNLKPYNNNM